jgi:tRNA (guanine37-N1)-methyltransferase
MRFDVITIFPEMIDQAVRHGVIRRAFTQGIVLKCWNPRDFATDNYRTIDDRPYGGGPGMVMLAEPLKGTVHAIKAQWQAEQLPPPKVILFSPAGKRLEQSRVMELVKSPGAILLCARYEGVDQRFIDAHVDEELSLGDYVLSGGELPALVLIDAVARHLPGVLGDEQSAVQESFSIAGGGLLDWPHYSRPEQLPEGEVPQVLLSGNHAAIARWRREQALRLTAERRPELLSAARQAGELSAQDEKFLKSLNLL